MSSSMGLRAPLALGADEPSRTAMGLEIRRRAAAIRGRGRRVDALMADALDDLARRVDRHPGAASRGGFDALEEIAGRCAGAPIPEISTRVDVAGEVRAEAVEDSDGPAAPPVPRLRVRRGRNGRPKN